MEKWPNKPALVEVRCTGSYLNVKAHATVVCDRLLAMLPSGTDYKIKCPRCGKVNEREKA